jgi:hypothetical protein
MRHAMPDLDRLALYERRAWSRQKRAIRDFLYNPRWPWHAAAHFGAHVQAPDQYLRSQPRQYPDLFDIGH